MGLIQLNKKYIFVGIVAFLVLGVGVYVGKKVWQESKYTKVADVDISPEQRQEFEQVLGEADQKLSQMLDEQDNDERIYLLITKAEAQYGLGLYGEAKKTLEQALKLDAGRHSALALLSKVERDMGNLESALKNIDTALFLSPETPEYWLSKIELVKNYQRADHNQMLEVYKSAAFGTKFHPEISISYARYMESLGDLGPALSFWKIALQSDPDNQTFKDEIKRLEDVIAHVYGE